MKHREVFIIGGGPAGLMAATQLIDAGFSVTIVDHKATVGRKFLVAGDGGFNLTHSEPIEQFVERYNHPYPKQWVRNYSPENFRNWLSSLGIETFVGSSGKVFPLEGIKPIQVLSVWTDYLSTKGVKWKLKTHLIDFTENTVRLQEQTLQTDYHFDFLIFALGGASWKKTGSDGTWLELFHQKDIPILPFHSSNSGLVMPPSDWLKKNEGEILKNIRLCCDATSVPGDLVITAYGLEGKPAYAVNEALRKNDFQGLFMDVKPQFSAEKIQEILKSQPTVRKAWSVLRLPESLYDLLRESTEKEVFTNPEKLAERIKAFPIHVTGLRPLDEVISTVGGVPMNAIDKNGKLMHMKHIYCCGEMLDWDAPTGGYLIQACVSSGYTVGKAIASET